MFHSVLKCVLYARSRRSISFWYFSTENGGGLNASRPCSFAKRAYIARIMSWISRRLPRGGREVAVDVAEELVHRAAHAARERAVLDVPARAAGVRAQRLEADVVEQVVGLLREHVAQRGEAREPALEQLLLRAHALHHVADDVLVLAAQRRAARRAARRRPPTRASRIARTLAGERAHLALRRRADDVALGGNEPLRQRRLERGQAASREQRVVAVHLGEQRLLRRRRVHLRRAGCRACARSRCTWRSISRVDLVFGLQVVPQAVDLVQDDDAARPWWRRPRRRDAGSTPRGRSW